MILTSFEVSWDDPLEMSGTTDQRQPSSKPP